MDYLRFFCSLVASLFLSVAARPIWAISATTTTLAVSSEGNSVTTLTSGSVITLTATVTSGGSPVSPGTVNFCDATATYCRDIHILGTAQLTSAGTAIARFVPGVGTQSIKAVFVGTSSVNPSSSPVVTLSVTGLQPSGISLTQTGVPEDYALTATVGSQAAVAPTGTVTFLDQSNGGNLLGVARLNQVADNFINTAGGVGPAGVVTADFNEDGLLDLAVLNPGANTVSILLGDGFGHFIPSTSPYVLNPETPSSLGPTSILAGDFNNDGAVDLVVLSQQNNDNTSNPEDPSLSLLFGIGDGTFKLQPPLYTQIGPISMVEGDFNGDGNLDLAITNYDYVSLPKQPGYAEMYLSIGFGDGTGGFNGTGPISLLESPTGLVAGDFNGDGITDIAVGAGLGNTVLIYLGNQNGVQLGNDFSIHGVPLISADFNQDGLSDLAVETSEGVGIFLANSNGQFTKTKQNLGFGNAYPFPPAVGDFNGDKIPDIIGVNPSNHDIDFLVGIGGGNFANLSGPPAGENPGYIAVGDFNGDGRQDFAAGNVWLSENGSAAATLTGISPNDSGRPSIIATYVGDSTYSPATASPLVLRATPAINLSPSANPLANGSSVQLTASVSGNGTTPSGKVRFMSGALELATVTLKSGFASFSTPALAVGQYSFKAIYDGDAFYGPLTSLAVDEVVNKAPQTISFPSLPKDDNYPVGSSIQLAATATSGLPITYQVTGHAIVTGSTLTFLAPGAVAITSYQDGNADYNPAKPVEQTVVVKPAR